MTRTIFILLCFSLFCGCRTNSPEVNDPDVSAPEQFAAGSSDKPRPSKAESWIKGFGSRELEKVVGKALKHNYQLEAASARIEQAAATARITRSGRMPDVNLNLNGTRRQQRFIGFPGGGGQDASGAGGSQGTSSSLSNQFGVALDLSWEIDLWGRVRAGESAALAEVESSSYDAAGLANSIAGQTAKAWFGLIEAGQQLQLARESQASFEESYEIIRDRFKRSEESSAQVRLAESNVANAKAIVAEREENQKIAARQVEILTAEYPAARVKAPAELPRLKGTPPAGIPAELLGRRPDLAAAERRIAASDRRIKEAKLALLPRISLTGSGGTATEEVSKILNLGDFGVWSIAGSTVSALVSGGEVLGEIARRKAVVREAVANYQDSALTAFAEVENALSSEQALARREIALQETSDLLAEAYREARDDYAKGVGDVLTVLTTQRQMLETRAQLLTIRRLRLDNRVDLHLALGGDFSR